MISLKSFMHYFPIQNQRHHSLMKKNNKLKCYFTI